MKIKLLERVGVYGPGVEWNHPWAASARKLIEEGKAVAVEPCDFHLNPAPAAGKPPKRRGGRSPRAGAKK